MPLRQRRCRQSNRYMARGCQYLPDFGPNRLPLWLAPRPCPILPNFLSLGLPILPEGSMACFPTVCFGFGNLRFPASFHHRYRSQLFMSERVAPAESGLLSLWITWIKGTSRLLCPHPCFWRIRVRPSGPSCQTRRPGLNDGDRRYAAPHLLPRSARAFPPRAP